MNNNSFSAEKILYDKDIRENLFEYLEDLYGEIRILEELVMGASRADVLMVSAGMITGLEIKSDADSYQRLETQVRDYDRYCDRSIIVAGSSHAEHVSEHVPAHWGIITVETEGGAPDFYMLRKPALNPADVTRAQLSLLWRIELKHIQDKNGLPKYKDRSRRFVSDRIYEKIPHDILKYQIAAELFDRDYTLVGAETAEFRRSETDKKLDTVTDPGERVRLIAEKNMRRSQLLGRTGKRKRRRTGRR